MCLLSTTIYSSFEPAVFTEQQRNDFNLEALPLWQTSETYNPSGQAFPHETRAGFHSSSSLTLSLPL